MYPLLFKSLFAAALLGFTAISFADGALRPIPQPDLSTPENALRSYWALKNWEHETLKMEVGKLRAAGYVAVAPYITKVTSGAAHRYFDALKDFPDEVLDRHIDQVSDGRGGQAIALVTIKNVSAIPADVKPTEAQLREREQGRKFKYVLVADGKDWKISEVWMLGGPEPYMGDRMLFETLPSYFPSQVWND